MNEVLAANFFIVSVSVAILINKPVGRSVCSSCLPLLELRVVRVRRQPSLKYWQELAV